MRLTRRAALAGLAAFLPGAARARIYADTVNMVGESLDEIRAKGCLKVAVYEDFAPFSAARDGRLAGIDCDIARLLAEKLGLRLELNSVQAGETVEDDLRNHIWRGGVVDRSVANLMLHVPYSRELETRSELAVLVQPYYTETFVVACDPARLEDEASLAALAGSTIGVELDSLPDFYLGSTLGGRLREGLVHYRRPEDGLDALLRGEITAFMGLRSQVEAGLGSERERFDLGLIPLAGLPASLLGRGCGRARERARPRLCSRRHPGWRRARRHHGRIFAVHGISYHPPPFA